MDNMDTGLLEPEVARETLFERILDKLAESSLFSSGPSPTIFIAYAHNNEKEGTAYDEYVRKLITWLEQVHAQILSDQSPLPPLVSKFEGTDPVGNILANQMCLLPPSCYGAETPKTICVDKVIVCGSEVMEGYCAESSANAYIKEIVQICNRTGHSANITLESAIRERVEKECDRHDFHHVLTELAFLEARKSGLPETHNMVPVVLSQKEPDEAPMRYLPVFQNTDVKLKLKSPAISSLHRLFFKLLKRLFPENRDFIKQFEQCYIRADEDVISDGGPMVIQNKFDEIVKRGIDKASQECWKISCVLFRNGKLQVYAGKLSDQVSDTLKHIAQSTQHNILAWLSPYPASKHHGIYHDSGTGRMEGTCDWVIRDEEFRRWYAFEGSALLFLCGNMGTGKTYATSRVVDWVKDGLGTSKNNEAFAYFYCNKQDPIRSEPKEILRNIIRQLATGPWKDLATNTAIHESVHALWLKDRGQGILSTFAEWEACLVKLIDTYPRTTIVLDAVDECKIQQRQDIINLLIKLASRKSDKTAVKVFVSARPEDDVLRQLEKHHIIRMQEKHNAEDIEYYIRAKLAEHRRLSKMSEEFQNKMVENLVEKSGDMFLFASLQIEQLRDCNTPKALRTRLSTLPNSLSRMYAEIYHSATSDPDEQKFLARALQWVLCSARPLTTRELLFAVSQDSGANSIKPRSQDLDQDMLLAWSHNLLSLDVGRWRLAHQAVADFLGRTCYDSVLAHCEVGKVCMNILLDVFDEDNTGSQSDAHEKFEDEAYNALHCQHGFDCDEDRELPESLAYYAVYAWPTHVRAQENCENFRDDGLSRNLQKFLGQPEDGSRAYLRWLDHAFYDEPDDIPSWSIFCCDRLMPGHEYGPYVMTPVILAFHLGIYTPLLTWWTSSDFDHNRRFSSDEWDPHPTLCDWATKRFQWSVVALACFNDETNIVKHLLWLNVRINPKENDEVPPIIAAAVADSVETVKLLLKFGADTCSPFTSQYGHILRFVIRHNSLRVMRLLLLEESLFMTTELEEIMRSLKIWDFESSDAMNLLLDTKVDVNTPLRDGSLLLIATYYGWNHIVCRLLKSGANVNQQVKLHECTSILGVLMKSYWRDPSIATELVNHGARVDSRIVIKVWKRSRPRGLVGAWEQLLQLLLGRNPDFNETWTDDNGIETSALIRAVRRGDLDRTRFLVECGADVNLIVGGRYGDAMGCLFVETLDSNYGPTRYPTGAIMDVLVEAGASLDNLKDEHLDTALAAVAFAGLEHKVHYFLDRGASPNLSCRHQFLTALGAAAASGHPRSPEIIGALLDSDRNVSDVPCFFRNARFAFDFPLQALLKIHPGVEDENPLTRAWLQSASALAQHHAVCDINFTQWRECLRLRRPEFSRQNVEALDQLHRILEGNRRGFCLEFSELAADEQWTIKDTGDLNVGERDILREMRDILDWHRNQLINMWE